jgi:SAM-dependent methyltransferase
MNRRQKLLARIDKSDFGMEVGAGYEPLLPKADGWNVLTVDHDDRETLVAKYRDSGHDVSRIEDVDVIWRGGPLHETVPEHVRGRLDFCVASHVLEHMPNPIAFFESCARLLKPRGILSLALPDKRYCFDFFQPISSTADFLHAWKLDARVHSGRAIFQQVAYSVFRDGSPTWGQTDRGGRLALVHSLAYSLERFRAAAETRDAPYEDCHAWRFTPSSFALIVLELSQLGLIEWSVDTQFPSSQCEFFVTLRNERPPPLAQDELDEKRLALLREGVREAAVQWRIMEPGAFDVRGRLQRAIQRVRRRFERRG